MQSPSSFSLKPMSQSLVSNHTLINKLHDLACSHTAVRVAFTQLHTKNTSSHLEEDFYDSKKLSTTVHRGFLHFYLFNMDFF